MSICVIVYDRCAYIVYESCIMESYKMCYNN